MIMGDAALAFTYVAIFGIIGGVVAVMVLARARVAGARADAEGAERYRELAERCADDQRRAADELARLTERVAAIEKLLRDVG
jgi:hypothetical protein